MHTTNYFDTFISVAEDCPLLQAKIPPQKTEKTVAALQFDLLYKHPYAYTSDEVVFYVHSQKKKFGKEKWEQEKGKFFSKGQPCLRCSPLTKRYAWGVHFNSEGKIAIYPFESEEYQRFLQDKSLVQTKGMRSKRE